MPRQTSMTGWWKLLLDKRANGDVALLASLVGWDPRTQNRVSKREHKMPNLEHRRALRKVAGEDLLNHPDCPKYLRLKKKV